MSPYNLNSLKIGTEIKIYSKKCPNTCVIPMPEIGTFISIDKGKGLRNELTRVVIEQTHKYKNSFGRFQVRPIKMFFYTINISEIEII